MPFFMYVCKSSSWAGTKWTENWICLLKRDENGGLLFIALASQHFLWSRQGCQMVCFQTKNPDLGKFWRVLDWKMFKYFMAIWNIFWRFEIFYDHSVHFVFIWYIFSGFGIMYQEKSGNPGSQHAAWKLSEFEMSSTMTDALPARPMNEIASQAVD
jgi:hypothetical protein